MSSRKIWKKNENKTKGKTFKKHLKSQNTICGVVAALFLSVYKNINQIREFINNKCYHVYIGNLFSFWWAGIVFDKREKAEAGVARQVKLNNFTSWADLTLYWLD